jgi:phage tail-like protein
VSEQRRAVLRVTGPDITIDTIEVTASGIKIGRLASNDIAFPHNKISREHSQFLLTDAGLTVQDLGSSNGTVVNTNRIEPNNPVPLKPGDTISLGPYVLTFDQIIEPGEAEKPKGKKPLDKTMVMGSGQTSEVAPSPLKETIAVSPERATPPAEPPAPPPPAPPKKEPEVVAQAPVIETPPAPPLGEVERETFYGSPSVSQIMQPPPPPPPIDLPERLPSVTPVDGGSKGPISPAEPPPPRAVLTSTNGHGPLDHPEGVRRDESSWMQYLPAIYGDDAFMGRFLLIFEALYARDEWIVDNIDLYLDPKMAPPEWLRWLASWVDIFVPATLPEDRQRAITKELPVLFMGRGSKGSLARHLELAFGIKPDIDEPKDKPYTFTVKLKLGKDGNTSANRGIATQIIESQRPAHTFYTLTIE